MNSDTTTQKEDQLQESLSIVELEERYEMTAAGGTNPGRCTDNTGEFEREDSTGDK